MFDTVAGLPLHPLVVHAVVVLLPVMALVTIAVAIRPAWRSAAVPVLVANVLVAGLTFVARQAGERFQARLSEIRGGAPVAQEHGDQGSLLFWFAVGLVVAALAVWIARSRPALVPVAIVLAVVTGLAAIAWTVVVGHSGAEDVWGGIVQSGAP